MVITVWSQRVNGLMFYCFVCIPKTFVIMRTAFLRRIITGKSTLLVTSYVTMRFSIVNVNRQGSRYKGLSIRPYSNSFILFLF